MKNALTLLTMALAVNSSYATPSTSDSIPVKKEILPIIPQEKSRLPLIPIEKYKLADSNVKHHDPKIRRRARSVRYYVRDDRYTVSNKGRSDVDTLPLAELQQENKRRATSLISSLRKFHSHSDGQLTSRLTELLVEDLSAIRRLDNTKKDQLLNHKEMHFNIPKDKSGMSIYSMKVDSLRRQRQVITVDNLKALGLLSSSYNYEEASSFNDFIIEIAKILEDGLIEMDEDYAIDIISSATIQMHDQSGKMAAVPSSHETRKPWSKNPKHLLQIRQIAVASLLEFIPNIDQEDAEQRFNALIELGVFGEMLSVENIQELIPDKISSEASAGKTSGIAPKALPKKRVAR